MALSAFEGAPIPDFARRAAVDLLVSGASRRLRSFAPADERTFAEQMAAHDIAEHAEAANAQHYELPAVFFEKVLGPHRKYSCCYYRHPSQTLAVAEAEALRRTVEYADLADGQHILELGCGWGSLSLWMASAYPKARIVSVSNSASQRRYIEGEADRLGLTNLTVITADMNDFACAELFDRVVSVEMFEHMSNWRRLLSRIRGWLKPDGRLYVHVFSHRSAPYRFDAGDPGDWIARHFFTGGVMPSHGLMRHFPDLFEVEQDWRWSGAHYAHTARAWLANYDRHAAEIGAILDGVYGEEAALWRKRWRLFFLATEGLFGHAGGTEWGVSHYRLKPA